MTFRVTEWRERDCYPGYEIATFYCPTRKYRLYTFELKGYSNSFLISSEYIALQLVYDSYNVRRIEKWIFLKNDNNFVFLSL